MSVYLVTGKLGNGKSLVSVGRIRDALRSGLRVATNLDINLLGMTKTSTKNIDLVRIPDKPVIGDLEAIGKGCSGNYDESKFGLLVLDECGTWFNSRNWQDKDRKAVNEWFLHARKLGWHVYIIIQDVSILDAQARDAIGELIVTCRRLDKLRVPFLAPIVKLFTGFNLTFPRIHRARVTYADGLLSDVWTYRGNDLFACYDTRQVFIQSYPHGTHSILTPWHTHGRYEVKLTWERKMRITKIYWKRFKSPLAMGCGVLMGAFFMLLASVNTMQRQMIDSEYLSKQRANVKTVIPFSEPKKAASSSSSTASEQKPSAPSTAEKTTAFLAGLRITGLIRENNLYNYLFSSGASSISSHDLVGMGFAISPMGECSVRITQDSVQQIVRCM